jgi:hypothetical protein
MAKEKEICACGCKKKLSRATINRHLGGKGPGTLALYVLKNTRALQRQGKKSKAGYSTKQILLGKTPQHSCKRSMKQRDVERTEEISLDSHEDLLEGDAAMGPQDDANIPMNEPMSMDEPIDRLPDQGDILSTARRSNRVAAKLVQVQQFRWGTGHVELTREEDEEDEEVEGVDTNRGSSPNWEEDEDEDEEDGEGISMWDLLGEDFLKEASELGMQALPFIPTILT